MLRDETRTATTDRPWSRTRRLATTACLLGVTAAVMTLRGPARGGEGVAPAPAASPAASPVAATLPPLYFTGKMDGVLVLRPAAAARHAAIKRLVPLLDDILKFALSDAARLLRVDRDRPGFVKLRMEDLEWIAMPIKFGRTKNRAGAPLHRLEVSSPAVRTVAPFDWPGFLRQWRIEFTEVREGHRVYYRISGPIADVWGPKPCFYLPDDRTIVSDAEDVIRKVVRGETPPLPPFFRGADWERACRGLVAYAIDNRGDALAKDYDLGRPDDAVVLSVLAGVDHCILSVDDADVIALRATAAVPGGATDAIARTLESLVKEARDFIEKVSSDVKPGRADDLEARICRALINKTRVEHDDHSIGVQATGFGTLADFVSLVEELIRPQPKPGGRKEGPTAAKR